MSTRFVATDGLSSFSMTTVPSAAPTSVAHVTDNPSATVTNARLQHGMQWRPSRLTKPFSCQN
jgi:hypothetical protein